MPGPWHSYDGSAVDSRQALTFLSAIQGPDVLRRLTDEFAGDRILRLDRLRGGGATLPGPAGAFSGWTTTSGPISSAPAATPAGTSGGSSRPSRLHPRRTGHPRPRRGAQTDRRDQAGPDRPHRRPAQPRPGRQPPVRRLRRQRRRHPQSAGGRAPPRPGGGFRSHEHEQGLRRPAQHDPPQGTADALGLRRPGLRGRHPRGFPDRPEQAQPVRGLQGRPPT